MAMADVLSVKCRESIQKAIGCLSGIVIGKVDGYYDWDIKYREIY